MFGGDLPHRILIKVLEEIVGPSEMVSDQEVVTKTSHFCLTFVLGASDPWAKVGAPELFPPPTTNKSVASLDPFEENTQPGHGADSNCRKLGNSQCVLWLGPMASVWLSLINHDLDPFQGNG